MQGGAGYAPRYVACSSQGGTGLVFARRTGGPDPDSLTREELASVLRAARSVNASGDLERTLDSVLEAALGLLEADEGSVMLLDPAGSELTIRAARGIPSEIVHRTRVRIGEGISGYVAASGTPLLLGSDAQIEHYADGQDRQRRLRSAVSVPLRVRGRTTGVLNVNLVVGGRRGADFGGVDLEVATLFAEFAAAAAHLRDLNEQSTARARDLSLLFEASHALSADLGVEEVAQHILDATEQLAGAIGGFVCLVGPGDDGLEIPAYRGVTRGRVMAVVRREGFATLLRGSQSHVVADTSTDDLLGPLAGGDTATGAVMVPLGVGETHAMLVALVEAGEPMDPAPLLSTYSAHASLALGRALLHRDVVAKEEELASLASAIPDPVIVVDKDGRFLAINPAAAEQFGLNPAFDLGQPVAGRLRSPELEDLLASSGTTGSDVSVPVPEPRTFHARVTAARPGHSPAGARILTLEDVTAERETERLKADFLAVMGHELRTPLTLIKGYSSTMARRGDALSAEARSRALDALHTQTVRLERLVEDLLLVARVERGRAPLHLERQDPGEVVRSAVAGARSEHPGRDIRFTTHGGPRPMPLDATKVEQVVRHLVDNAVKFSDEAQPVDVEVNIGGDSLLVRVVDRGQGIFSGDIPRLFERFHQVDGSATRAHGGTGVGLYICRTLVEAHGGEIGVRSALGRGSTFWFVLPLEQPDDAPADPVVDVGSGP